MKPSPDQVFDHVDFLIRSQATKTILEEYCRTVPEPVLAAAAKAVQIGQIAEHISFLHNATADQMASVLRANELERLRRNFWVQAVDSIKSTALLRELVVGAESSWVQQKAFRKLNDPQLAKQIFESELTSSKSPSLANDCLSLISDDAWLANLIWEKPKVRMLAGSLVRKISDQSLLKKLAFEHSDESVRQIAATKLTNKADLAEIALKESSPYIRREVIQKINDQEVLKTVAKNDPNNLCKDYALYRITDKEFFVRLERESPDADLRKMATSHLSKRFT